MLLNKNDVDDAEKLYLWRTVHLRASQKALAERFDVTQTAISKMEIGYEDRGGIPVNDEVLDAIDDDWPTMTLTLSSQACLMRRREWFSKAEAACQVGLCTYQIGQMENPRHWREPSEQYIEWLQS